MIEVRGGQLLSSYLFENRGRYQIKHLVQALKPWLLFYLLSTLVFLQLKHCVVLVIVAKA